MTNNLTSIIIPMLNESAWIINTLLRCVSLPLRKEIIVVDNDSADGSYSLVEEFIETRRCQNEIKLLSEPNQGKTNGVKRGLSIARGDYIVFHDADLEYDPAYIPALVSALQDSDIAIGSRNCRPYSISTSAFIANKILLDLVRRKYASSISDIFTAQRAFRRNVIESLPLTSTSFEMETELTLRALNGGYTITEVDVPYRPRTRAEGKKIGWTDFLAILRKFYSVSRQISSEKKRGCVEVTNP